MNHSIPSTIAAGAPAEKEWALLQGLDVLMAAAAQALGDGEAQSVQHICQQVQLRAQELSALSLQIAKAPQDSEAQLRRQQLLLDIRRRTAFCRAILRRWRRSLTLREQLLEMRTQPASYADPFSPAQELR